MDSCRFISSRRFLILISNLWLIARASAGLGSSVDEIELG